MAAGPHAGAADPAEIAKFEAMAAEWWDPEGKFRPLHAMNPCRLDYAVRQIAAQHGRDRRRPRALEGLRVLDIGCGGGLMAEPMARLGARVTGVDAAAESIAVARLHGRQAGLDIDYRAGLAETLADAGETFDVVLDLEVIEHVPDPAAHVATAARLLAPGGLLLVSTLNRTSRSWLLGVVAAERVLGWLPRGTHDWDRFLTPDELHALIAEAGLEPVDRKGFVFDPLEWTWRLSPSDLSVNYVVAAVGRP
ncbi:MAG TPA: bifunctional 2-polyprenyl-6-hydroxyphenol methylase/3-demethylubiquinol 3-O-methyltransferase UbiG [Thermohalobaculum sp.]|nr:bifunctional 2-polyprenyl-6-hydroxyphenol methylase/3-demethylubiquinol 3-O-methyltransferase UbiG [Thermohalobaculum sp.]